MDTTTERCLSVRQPWAALLCLGRKQFETRSHRTSVRGTIVIHAAKAMPIKVGEIAQVGRYELLRDTKGLMLTGAGLPNGGALRLPVGVFLGTVYLSDCIQVTVEDLAAGKYSRDEVALGDFAPGRWLWQMKTPRTIAPVPGRGQLGFFRVPVDRLLSGVGT